MSKIKNFLKGGVLAVILSVIMAAPTFAATKCTGDYSGLHTGADPGSKVKCVGAYIEVVSGTSTTREQIWGDNSAACAKAGSLAANPEPNACTGATGLNSTIQLIINMIIFVIGLIAVIMVIMGGVQYSTSQGDSGKVKKAKDTIMYGIIGLVVAVLAFAIVNFVLSSII